VHSGFSETAFLYSVKFLRGNPEIIIAGGSGGIVKIFEECEATTDSP
jgi:hypothetical protein